MSNEQNEDWMLDENFRVETGFLERLSPEEEEYALRLVKPCTNCGEFNSPHNLDYDGVCNICNISENHQKIRGGSMQASRNHTDTEKLVSRYEKLREE